MAAQALLEHDPNPSEDAIKAWMMSNLCRCTGYYGIVRSVKAAAGGAS
jgi:aerobic-type carbon monoxide dehydrogenase small subunit (CoxS/CutS family)